MGIFKSKPHEKTSRHRLTIGLGVAIRRLVALEFKRRNGVASANEKVEIDLLHDALNTIPLELEASCVPGEDLNKDGRADTVEFFELITQTDCCILDRPAPANKKDRL